MKLNHPTLVSRYLIHFDLFHQFLKLPLLFLFQIHKLILSILVYYNLVLYAMSVLLVHECHWVHKLFFRFLHSFLHLNKQIRIQYHFFSFVYKY